MSMIIKTLHDRNRKIKPPGRGHAQSNVRLRLPVARGIIKTLLKPYYYLTIYTCLKSIIIILHTTLGA